MKTIFLAASLWLAATAVTQAQTPNLFDKMTVREAAAVTLETNLDDIQDNRRTEETFPGLLTLEDGTSLKANLSVRGKFRRLANKYPPLKVKVPKKALAAAGLDTLNEFKLILPYDDTKAAEEWVVKEYLSYRMFEQLTSNSVHARLLQLTLKDSRTGKTNAMYCLAVEDKEQTLARIKGTVVDSFNITENQLDQEHYALTAVFQYLIGNTDWGVHTNRNVRIVQAAGYDNLLVVPYDLDYSGMVNPVYARPSLDYGLSSVTERYFMGQTLSSEHIRQATGRFVQSRDALFTLCQSPYLSKKGAKDMTTYLESFYKLITPEGDLKYGTASPAGGTGSMR